MKFIMGYPNVFFKPLLHFSGFYAFIHLCSNGFHSVFTKHHTRIFFRSFLKQTFSFIVAFLWFYEQFNQDGCLSICLNNKTPYNNINLNNFIIIFHSKAKCISSITTEDSGIHTIHTFKQAEQRFDLIAERGKKHSRLEAFFRENSQ